MDQENFKKWLIAVRRKAKQDEAFAQPSGKSRGFLTALIKQRLQDKSEAKIHAVLQALTGLAVTSTRNLTQQYISTLIEEIVNADQQDPDLFGSGPVAYVERFLETFTGIPKDAFPWEHPGSEMPLL